MPGESGGELNKQALVESLLFSSRGLDADTISKVTGLTPAEVRSIIERLKEVYSAPEHGVELKEIEGFFRFYTKPEYARYVSKVAKRRNLGALSTAQLEIVVFLANRKQATKLEIDGLRGKDSSALLRQLLSAGVVKRRKSGRSYVYALTEAFRDESMIEELLRQGGFTNLELTTLFGEDETTMQGNTVESSTQAQDESSGISGADGGNGA